jgi:hypothetical protein
MVYTTHGFSLDILKSTGTGLGFFTGGCSFNGGGWEVILASSSCDELSDVQL